MKVTKMLEMIMSSNVMLESYTLLVKKGEYDQTMQQPHTADHPMAPRRRDAEHLQPHNSNMTIKVKQPDLSSLVM